MGDVSTQNCNGFVQVDQDISLRDPISSLSVVGADPYVFNLKISQVRIYGHWWLIYEAVPLRYWPSSLFRTLRSEADYISWGGIVYNAAPGGQHSRTQMGSGHYPKGGFNMAAFFDACNYYDQYRRTAAPQVNFYTEVSASACYDISMPLTDEGYSGLSFFYGGTGYLGCDG